MSPTDTKKTKYEREKKLGFSSPKQTLKQTMSAERGQSDAGQPMPEKGEEKKQPNPRVRGNMAQAQGVPSQNNDGRGRSINNDEQRKSDGLGTSTVQPDPQLSTPSSRMSSCKMKRFSSLRICFFYGFVVCYKFSKFSRSAICGRFFSSKFFLESSDTI